MIDLGTRTSWTHNAANQPLTERLAGGTAVTFTYDNSGNRQTKKVLGAVTTFVRDEDSRLTAVKPVGTPVTMTYNADGKRIRKES